MKKPKTHTAANGSLYGQDYFIAFYFLDRARHWCSETYATPRAVIFKALPTSRWSISRWCDLPAFIGATCLLASAYMPLFFATPAGLATRHAAAELLMRLIISLGQECGARCAAHGFLSRFAVCECLSGAAPRSPASACRIFALIYAVSSTLYFCCSRWQCLHIYFWKIITWYRFWCWFLWYSVDLASFSHFDYAISPMELYLPPHTGL